MSLQFALAPLGGGFLKQRDRLGQGGREGEVKAKENGETGGRWEEKKTRDIDN